MSLLFWHRLAGSASLLSYSLNNSFLKSHLLFFAGSRRYEVVGSRFRSFITENTVRTFILKIHRAAIWVKIMKANAVQRTRAMEGKHFRIVGWKGSYVIQILVLLVTLYYRKYSAWWRQRSKHCAKAPRWKPRMMQHSRSRRNNKIKKTQKARRDSNFSTPEREWR